MADAGRKGDRLLAIDCSLRLTGVALMRDGVVVTSESQDLGRRQAAELPLVTERLLKDAGWAWNDVGLVAVASGPGYFTGIRVGASYASALAYGLGTRIVGVPSLEMLAASCPEYGAGGGVLPVVYAGRGFVYAASFGCEDALAQGEYTGEALNAWLARHEDVTVISDDPERAVGAIGLDTPIRPVRPDVTRLAALAWARRSEAVHPFELRVSYCRAPQGTESYPTL